MFYRLPERKVLYLIPIVATLLAFLEAGTVTVSGAPRSATIKAESWSETAAQRAGLGKTTETYDRSGFRTRRYESSVHRAGFKFNALASTWDVTQPPRSVIRLFVRTSQDGAGWSEWMALGADDDSGMGEGRNFGNLLVLNGSMIQYQIQLVARASSATPEVSSVGFTFINSEDGPGPADLSASRGVAFAAESPRIITRAQWGALESLRFDDSGREVWPREYTRPVKAIIHETATINHDPNPPATIRAIYYYHAIVRGWGDIGYNYLVDEQGNVYEGRAGGTNVVGGHARCFNWGTIGIAALGDFSRARPSAAMVSSIENLLAWKFSANRIDPYGHGTLGSYAPRDIPNIAGHIDLRGVCGNTHVDPGYNLRSLFPAIRNSVAESITGGAPPARKPKETRPRAPDRNDDSPPKQKEPSYTVVDTDGWGLHLRDRPRMSSRVLAVVPEGQVVQEITSKLDGWVRINYMGATGYLWHEYLQERGTAPEPGSHTGTASGGGRARGSLHPGASAVVSGTPGALRLREGPGMEYKTIVKMWEGMGVRVTDTPRGGWYPVVYTDGYGRKYSGWTWGEYLKPGKSRLAHTAGAAALAGAMIWPAWRLRKRRKSAPVRRQHRPV